MDYHTSHWILNESGTCPIYRVGRWGIHSDLIARLGRFCIKPFHPPIGSAWADVEFAELAEHLGKMVKHYSSKSTQLNYKSGCPTLYVQTCHQDSNSNCV